MQFKAIFPRTKKVLPPAGGYPRFVPMLCSFSALFRKKKEERVLSLIQDIHSVFRLKDAVYFSSAKSALYTLFSVLSENSTKQVVALSAYTCPDIAVAAIKAGFELILLDTEAESVKIDIKAINKSLFSKISAVVISNLYGIPEDLEFWEKAGREYGFLVIDDGCQSFGSSRSGVGVGRASDSIGVFSFGRGKAVHGIGGGGLVINEANASAICSKISEALKRRISDCKIENSILEAMSSTATAAIFRIFEIPYCYIIPARLPFLGLGQTKIEFNFSLRPQTLGKLLVAKVQAEQGSWDVYQKNANLWAEHLGKLKIAKPMFDIVTTSNVVLVRFPLIFGSSRQRELAYYKLTKAGLGVSKSYPCVVSEFSEFKEHIVEVSDSNAKQVARRIMTLPVHRYLLVGDIKKTIEVLNSI
jgi:perosamine synthetase